MNSFGQNRRLKSCVSEKGFTFIFFRDDGMITGFGNTFKEVNLAPEATHCTATES